MVALAEVQASNARIATALPAGLVAVFAGGTSGIGEYSVHALARRAKAPRIYIVGRSRQAGERIAAECRAANPEGTYVPLAADLSTLAAVDELCREVRARETAVNLLVISIGSLVRGVETKDGIDISLALFYHSRVRIITNLLPLLEAAPSLRRVMCIGAGTKEGALDLGDLPARRARLLQVRGHVMSMTTLALEAAQRRHRTVSFVHGYPGPVRTGIGRGSAGAAAAAMRAFFAVVGPFLYMPSDECGERHVYALTSARYPPAEGRGAGGVPPSGGVAAAAAGTDGGPGTGVYTIDQYGEPGGAKVVALLAGLREAGAADKVWSWTEDEFRRITGTAAPV